ncbi:polysaccharide biosynthesis C-terminal domain-containing protein [Lactobacillus crispatus]|nr:polysaccharide biosynthesis C-terminal domain-containing protein [Lactobacillus crispatus]
MLSKEVVLIISGRSFLAATPSLQILCFALIFSLFSWVMSDCVLIPIKREKFVLIGTVISAIINICLNLILIPFWSEKAAALSTVAAEASMMISNLYFSRDIISKIIKSGNFRNNLLSSLLGCSGIVLICWLCDIGWESFFLKTLFSIILSVVIYGAILIFLNNATIISIMKGIKNKFIKYK